jgi:RNA polymerase sigma factor (sigma-70 family)
LSPSSGLVFSIGGPRHDLRRKMSGDDPRARFDLVVAPHIPDALSLARWLSGNQADAEDIVQDACLRAFRAIDTYHGGSARAWLLTIVRRTAYSWFSENRKPQLVAVDDLKFSDRLAAEHGESLSGLGQTTPEAELIAKADAVRLEAAIAALPLEFREVFVLREVQGLGYREIADVTATAMGTVMSRLARARRRLFESINQE